MIRIYGALVLIGHHSLVTPIDWKQEGRATVRPTDPSSHHSLVTPIDWKLRAKGRRSSIEERVTTRW